MGTVQAVSVAKLRIIATGKIIIPVFSEFFKLLFKAFYRFAFGFKFLIRFLICFDKRLHRIWIFA